jgi:AcrR family transcriptional regulator
VKATVAQPARRTQRERREETIGKLVEATIASLLEVGYARTSVAEICGRAGVSHGALFRHFDGVIQLILAAAAEVARRQLADFDARFALVPAGDGRVLTALTLLRDACRAPINTVFYELLIAARTDPDLHAALAENLRAYYDAILAAAKRTPEIAALPAEIVEPLLFGLVHMFDGEALVRGVLASPEVEDLRLVMLARAIESITR